MKVSTENLLKGLNIGKIEIEPTQEDNNYYAFRNKKWSWEDGKEYGLTCHLEVYAKEDFSFETYINNIKVIDDNCNVIELTNEQEDRIEAEIRESIEILSLQY